jgi:hypothetical protein
MKPVQVAVRVVFKLLLLTCLLNLPTLWLVFILLEPTLLLLLA